MTRARITKSQRDSRKSTFQISGDTLYKCLTAHQSQDSWSPDVSPSLWVHVDDPSVEFPEWIQPTGATDAYMKGDKVSHNEKHWVSDYDNNTWEPGVFGWTEM